MAGKLSRSVVVCVVALVLASCSDDPVSPDGTPALTIGPLGSPQLVPADTRKGLPVASEEYEAAETIARTIALALRDAQTRTELFSALASSNVEEGKLHLATFLNGGGARLLARGLDRSSISPSAFATTFSRVRDLEFYMPVPEHRQQWTGGEVLVVAAMVEDEDPVAFTTDGERIRLSITSPPSVPTLVLTPSEARFHLSAGTSPGSPQCSQRAAETLEQALRRCSNGTSGYSSSTTPGVPAHTVVPSAPRFSSVASDPTARGLYTTFIHLTDVHEPWTRGKPELEMHIVGRSGSSNSNYRPFQCAGEYAHTASGQPGIRHEAYFYNQNGNTWQDGIGVLLLSPQQVDAIQVWDPAGYFIQFWEDDDTACVIKEKTAEEVWRDILTILELATPMVKNVITGGGANPLHIASSLLAVGGRVIELIRGGDDFIGTAVLKDQTAWGHLYPENTHVILGRNGGFAGRATITFKTWTRTASLFGTFEAPPNGIGIYHAAVSGAESTTRFTWMIWPNGTESPTVVQDGTSPTLQYQNVGEPYKVIVSASDSYGHVGSAEMDVIIGGSQGCEPQPPAVLCDL